MKTSKPLQALAAIAAAGGLLALASQAQAHAHLVTSTPAKDAATGSPKQISLTFSERLEPKFSGVELMQADGKMVPVKSAVAKDRKTISASVAKPLTPGAYMVMWHVVSGDGHRMKGDYNFNVR